MEKHLIVIFYISSTLLGFFTMAICLAGTIRSKIKLYWMLFVFYTAFTLMLCITFLNRFLMMSGLEDSTAFTVLHVINLLLNFTFMTSITLFMQQYLIMQKQRLLSIFIILFNVFANLMLFLYEVLKSNPNTEAISQSLLMQGASSLHLLVFIFLITLGIKTPKKNRTIREQVLLWALVVFAIFGLLDSLGGTMNEVDLNLIGFIDDSFLVSSLPYILFSLLLIYYFGSYILADLQPSKEVSMNFQNTFKLSTRELEVIVLMNKGMNNPEIAEKLCLSIATIKTHAHNIYTKTSTKNRYELFHLFLKYN